jgi:hypothetical protein
MSQYNSDGSAVMTDEEGWCVQIAIMMDLTFQMWNYIEGEK